jgi:hypothetical protein
MMDFTKLRGGPDGWRGSFERLVCHLAEVDPPHDAVEFRPIEGAGGDGGIEAYWVLRDGTEIGYQAKCHLKAGDIDWAAVENSVATALSTHPKLVRMIVAMPCDLTDVTARKGTSARQKWNERREKWEKAAEPRQVAFEFLSGSQIERFLTRPAAAGLSEYWFGEQILSDRWFREKFAGAVAALDERYHPEDHVDVRASDLFHGLRGSAAWRLPYADLAKAIADAVPLTPDPESAIYADHRKVSICVDQLMAMIAEAPQRANNPFPSVAWGRVVAGIDAALSAIQSQLWRQAEDGAPSHRQREELQDYGEAREAAKALRDRLVSPYQRADDVRYAIIEGEAGSGKSHLAADAVQKALDAGEPAILLLGNDFGQIDDPGVQIARRLGLQGMSTDALLGALEAAAAERGTRALIVIDALNEGAGGRYWRHHLAAFAGQVARHSRLALCVSCRDVYSGRVLSAAARANAAQITIEGFETAEEMEAAAAIYMDKRGIDRPASPWWPPEFSNPLFLRATCTSLTRKGQRSFPLGLRGAREMMAFYLQATATTLGTEYDGTDELEKPLIRGVLALGEQMARTRRDYVERSDAARILDDAFGVYHRPADRTWLELLRLGGLLRADPPEPLPGEEEDPLDGRDDVLRFSFQRMQDYLIARSLTKPHDGPAGLFGAGEPLAFLLGKWGVDYDWRGVFEALTVQFADEWKVEIVDHLPGGFDDWWHDQAIEDAFVDSVRWRQHSSFGPRTAQLLSKVGGRQTSIDLLIELSAVDGHPWNADFMHRHLLPKAMPDRDVAWTISINGQPEERSAAHKLTEWGFGPGPATASAETIRLALSGLGWLFTSTNWTLRDLATKSATEILLLHPQAADGFLARFACVDDPYVPERAIAAIAGACLRDPVPRKVGLFADAVWQHVFQAGRIPLNVLARDHARLVIELAAERAVLPSACDLDRCRPPYGSQAPRFGLKEETVKAECKAVGDYSIFSSTAGWGGDFGNYVVKHRLAGFSAVALEKPLRSVEQAYEDFKRALIEPDELRSTLLSILENVAEVRELQKDDATETLGLLASVEPEVEAQLLELLGKRGAARYRREARPFLSRETGYIGVKGGKVPRIDRKQASLWIARRAIELGWTKERFPRDHNRGGETRRSGRIERIGKKYQWIAYHELIARLADNFWLHLEYEEEPARRFDTPVDLSFLRDFEPTLPPLPPVGRPKAGRSLPDVPRLQLADVAAENMHDWVFDDGTAASRLALALCPDLTTGAGNWVTLYRYTSRSSEYQGRPYMSGAPFRLNDFHFLMMIGVKPGEQERFAERARTRHTDFFDWMQWGDLTDGPYLYEAGIRDIWPETEWVEPDSFRDFRHPYLRMCREYRWEHHLDGTLPDGFSLQVPNRWVMRDMGLTADPYLPGVWKTADGTPTIISSVGDRNSFCLARKNLMEALLARRGVTPLWLGFGERGAWPDANENAGPNRRWNGVAWQEADALRHLVWAKDHRPGAKRRRKQAEV